MAYGTYNTQYKHIIQLFCKLNICVITHAITRLLGHIILVSLNNYFYKIMNSQSNLEYTALRDEVLKRIELRQNLISITLTIAGVILGFGITKTTVALIYPPISFFLALLWAQNDIRSGQIDDYLQQFENDNTGMNWVTYYKSKVDPASSADWPFSILAPGGTFITTELIAIGIGISGFAYKTIEWGLLLLDIIAILLTVWLVKLIKNKRELRKG